ncbi:hypothetical protein [Halocatena halophila]|uniref:hypothetical protein n=1 Tax=Halocatena halophila TaxID=2814576 RepID=UPI002ED5DFBD
MAGNLAKQALEKGMRAVGVDPNDHPDRAESGAVVLDAEAYDQLVDELDTLRIVYLSLPAESLIDDELEF